MIWGSLRHEKLRKVLTGPMVAKAQNYRIKGGVVCFRGG